jgi:hypothetical protein
LLCKVYAIGEKYDITPLKDLAKTQTEILLMEWTPTYFFTAMNEVYESTIAQDRGLRDIYVQVAVAQGLKLFDNQEFEEVIDQNGQFWKDYSKRMQGKYSQIKCTSPSCLNEFSTLKFHPSYPGQRYAYCPACNHFAVRI